MKSATLNSSAFFGLIVIPQFIFGAYLSYARSFEAIFIAYNINIQFIVSLADKLDTNDSTVKTDSETLMRMPLSIFISTGIEDNQDEITAVTFAINGTYPTLLSDHISSLLGNKINITTNHYERTIFPSNDFLPVGLHPGTNLE